MVPWLALADIFTFTENSPEFGPDASSYVNLHDIGAVFRLLHVANKIAVRDPQLATTSAAAVVQPSGWIGYIADE